MSALLVKSEFIVGGKYRLTRKIGSGSFGDIYLGINISNGEVNNIPYFTNLYFYSIYKICEQLLTVVSLIRAG